MYMYMYILYMYIYMSVSVCESSRVTDSLPQSNYFLWVLMFGIFVDWHKNTILYMQTNLLTCMWSSLHCNVYPERVC